MEKLMQDKVGIVTAGGMGIGRASALTFADEGAKVVVSDVSEKAGNETVDLIKKSGGEAIFVKCDVSIEDEVKSLVEATIEAYGQLDWAHNNAGIGAPTRPVTETKTSDWNRAMNINLDGMYFCLKYEVPAMIQSGGGAIVNTASTSGLEGSAELSTYAASKWGVNGLTKSVALEFGKQGVRINSICPGMTLTGSVEAWAKEVPDQAKAFEASIPLGKMGRVEDQANAAVWLCSEKAAFITGINLPVDGGQTAG